MAQSDILGLFATPQMYQQQRDLAEQQQAAALAQMDPYSSIRFGAIRAGQQFGRGLAGLLGAQDPQLQLISQRQALSQSIDPSKPDSIFAAAQRAAESGDQQFALTLADYARKAQSEIALQQQRLREGKAAATPKELQIAAAKAEYQDRLDALKAQPQTPERDRAIRIIESTLAAFPTGKTGQVPDAIEIANARADAQGLAAGSPARNEFINKELERLTTKEAKTPTANIKEVGVATGTNKAVYLDVNNDQQFTYERGADGKQVRQPYFGGIDRTTAKVTASANAQQESEFKKGLGRGQAKRYDDAIAIRDGAIASLNSLEQLTRLDQRGLISGAFATNRVGVANFLNTIGLASKADADRLSTSQNYQKVAADVIFATLQGKLGAGISNADREFIERLIPQLETSPQARKELLDYLVTKNQSLVDETTRLINYAEEKGTLNNFVPKIPLVSPPKPGSVAAMTDEELKAAISKGSPDKGKK